MTTEEVIAIEARLALQDQRIQAQTVVIGGLIQTMKVLSERWKSHDDQLAAFDRETDRIHDRLRDIEELNESAAEAATRS